MCPNDVGRGVRRADEDEAAADVEPGNAHPAHTRLTASNSPAASAVRSAPA